MGLKNEENFQKKCRLCGRLGRRFTDIFTPQLSSTESKPNKKLSQLIFKCLQLQVSICICIYIHICVCYFLRWERYGSVLRIRERTSCNLSQGRSLNLTSLSKTLSVFNTIYALTRGHHTFKPHPSPP
jgi:hypothetical protein